METRANYALIGAFTLAIVAAAFMFVFWFSRSTQAGTRDIQIVFTTSVSGLSRGSSVLFNGVRVGEVTHIELAPDNPGRVFATIEVSNRAPVKVDTRARLEYQGLTGVASIALLGGSPEAKALQGERGGPPVMIAERSDYQNILETLQRLAGRTEQMLDSANSLFATNSESIGRTVRNVEAFSQALGDNADGVREFMSAVSEIGSSVRPLVASLEKTARTIDERIQAIDPAQVRSILDNADSMARQLNASAGRIDKLMTSLDGFLVAENAESIGRTVRNVEAFSQALGDNAGGVREFMAAVSDIGSKVGPLVASLEATARNVDERVQAIDPAQLRSILDNADSLAKQLNASAGRIDKLMTSLDGFLGAGDGKGVMAEIGEAAISFRKLAENLDTRTRELTAGLSRFTGSGLRQYEALAADGRRTLDEINRTLRSIERNPQQLIFGRKPSTQEYRGR
jgi:phospholipid/cholesterol/gamma-HCH transport system substrate-binding protein